MRITRTKKTIAAIGLGVGLMLGGVIAPASAASAAPQVWYKITGYSKADCQWQTERYRGWGARIVTPCHYRSYDQKYAFSYYWIS